MVNHCFIIYKLQKDTKYYSEMLLHINNSVSYDVQEIISGLPIKIYDKTPQFREWSGLLCGVTH
jgi:hypothetical protein